MTVVSPGCSPVSHQFALLPSAPVANSSSPASGPEGRGVTGFDISTHINLVPPFREAEAESYFTSFAGVAAALPWPKEMWALLLQCKLVGKAQEVCSSLHIKKVCEGEANPF